MTQDIKCALNGVLTGLIFGLFGISTGANFWVVAIGAVMFATTVELIRFQKEHENSKMSTSYQNKF